MRGGMFDSVTVARIERKPIQLFTDDLSNHYRYILFSLYRYRFHNIIKIHGYLNIQFVRTYWRELWIIQHTSPNKVSKRVSKKWTSTKEKLATKDKLVKIHGPYYSIHMRYLMKPSIGSGVLSKPFAARKDFVLLPSATKNPNIARSLSNTCNVGTKKRNNQLIYLTTSGYQHPCSIKYIISRIRVKVNKKIC